MRTTGRLMRLVVTCAFLVAVGWLAWRSVSVHATRESIEITVDKQQLKEAGRVAAREGRQALDKAGQLLHATGDALEEAAEPEEQERASRPVFRAPWSRVSR